MSRAATVRRLRRVLRDGGVPARRSPRPDGRGAHLQEYNPYHDKSGKFTTKGRASKGGGLTVTSNVALAQKILYEGGRVQLDSPRTVSTLLDKLGAASMEAFEKGTKAQNFDLCKVSVKGTNLFCKESKGIPRIEMPQLGGTPVAGSRASKLPKDKNGEVDVSAQFRAHLMKRGTRVTDEREKASYLKASQNQLVGPKVAGMMAAAQAGKFDPSKKAIFISKDNYVIDGHHRWAATVGMDALKDGRLGGLTMPVIRVNMGITDVLKAANDFTREFGIAPKAGKVKESTGRPPARSPVDLAAEAALRRLREYNPYHDKNGKFTSKGKSSVYSPGKKAAGKLGDTARADAEKYGGASVRYDKTGKLTRPTKGFMVSYAGSERQIPMKGLDKAAVRKEAGKFVRENSAKLADPKNHLGAWVSRGKLFLDISRNVNTEAEARKMGVDHKQYAIYDVKNDKVIELGVRE